MKRNRKGSQQEPEERQKGAQGHDKGSKTEPKGDQNASKDRSLHSILTPFFNKKVDQKSMQKKIFNIFHTCGFYRGKTTKCE